jgi:hypothetical protein
MNEQIRELKIIHSRMTTALNELEVLEDGVNVDYNEIIVDYRWIVNMLENRRETLQRRGRRL